MPHSAVAASLGRGLVHSTASTADKATAWVDVLADVPLFSGLNRRHLKKVAQNAKIARFEGGTPIVRAGTPGDAFYVVLDGTVTVSRRGLPALTLEAGSFFGELSLLDGASRSATVTAKGEVGCLVVPRSRFLKLLRSEPAIAVAMVEEVAKRLRAAQTLD